MCVSNLMQIKRKETSKQQKMKQKQQQQNLDHIYRVKQCISRCSHRMYREQSNEINTIQIKKRDGQIYDMIHYRHTVSRCVGICANFLTVLYH